MRAHPRDQRKTRGKKKKSQRNPRTSRSRSKGVAESWKVLPFEALPFKLSKRARNVLIRELPGQTTRPIFPSSAGTGNFATREQVSPLQGDVVKNQSALWSLDSFWQGTRAYRTCLSLPLSLSLSLSLSIFDTFPRLSSICCFSSTRKTEWKHSSVFVSS